MNSEQTILILVIALVLIVLLLVGLVVYLFFQLLKKRDVHLSTEPSVDPKVEKDPDIQACVNHEDRDAVGVCAICNESFCDSCIKEHDGLAFCRPHFRMYVSHDWVSLEEIKTTPDTPESALPIYDFKQDLWGNEETPAIISTHYKINIEGDYIESYVKLLVRQEEEENLRDRYVRFKN